jgi:hypothetical protein
MAVREQALLDEIRAFLRETRITRTQFGIGAVNDAKLISDLEGNRQLLGTTKARVIGYMEKMRRDESASQRRAS